MITLVNWLFFGIAFFAGSIVIAFTAGQIIAVMSVWIRILLRLKNNGLLLSNRPFFNCAVQVLILLTLLTLAVWLVLTYFPSYAAAFIFGAGFTLLVGQRKAVELGDNLVSVLQANRKYVHDDAFSLTDSYEIQMLFDINDESSLEPNEFFAKYLGDAVSHFFFYSFFVGFIFLLGALLWWAGVVVAVLYWLLMAYSVIHLLIGFVMIAQLWKAIYFSKRKQDTIKYSGVLWYSLGMLAYGLDILYLTVLAVAVFGFFFYR